MEKKLNILIVDGDVSEAEELENELNREFDIVGTVFDGMKAVDEIIRKKPEVVLIDIMLPYIDGVGVIEKCRECMEYEQLPVFIVLTSIGTEKLIECVNHMDIDYCMMRPFKNEVLCRRIKQVAKIKGLDQKIIQKETENNFKKNDQRTVIDHEFHMKQDEIADRVSKSRTAVTNSMRLLKLSKQVQQMVIDEMISTGHARCLISIEDPELQHQLALRIFDEKLSVRETEKLVRKLLQENNAPQKKINDPVLSAIYADLADQMKRIFGTKVEIHQRNDQKGKIEIEYYSQDELNRLIELIQSIQQQ